MRSMKLSAFAIAFAAAASVGAQPSAGNDTGGAPAGSKQADYDCSGMTWIALDNCLRLNAQAEALGARSGGRATTGVVESEREQRVQPEPGAQR